MQILGCKVCKLHCTCTEQSPAVEDKEEGTSLQPLRTDCITHDKLQH